MIPKNFLKGYTLSLKLPKFLKVFNPRLATERRGKNRILGNGRHLYKGKVRRKKGGKMR